MEIRLKVTTTHLLVCLGCLVLAFASWLLITPEASKAAKPITLSAADPAALPLDQSQHLCAGAWGPLNVAGGSEGNPLWTYFQEYRRGPRVDKWYPYFDVYHRYFCRFRRTPGDGRVVRFLEIGVQSEWVRGTRNYINVALLITVDLNSSCAPPS